MSEISMSENAQLRLLYQVYTDAIERAKHRQWATPYYTLLGYAAIIGFYHLTKSEFLYVCWKQKSLLLVPAFLLSILGTWILIDIQKCLCTYRLRNREIEKTFTKRAQTIVSRDVKKVSMYERYFLALIIPFIFLMIVGLIYVTWLLAGDKWSLTFILPITIGSNLLIGAIFYYHNSRKVEEFRKRLGSLQRMNPSEKI